ncbi:MAG: hypothetical protein GWP39_03230 [Planctomycetia bacterium]|nr:hypothetical protein [Planctomycetia bacterium]
MTEDKRMPAGYYAPDITGVDIAGVDIAGVDIAGVELKMLKGRLGERPES